MRFTHTRLRAAAFAVSLSVFVLATGAPAPVEAATPAASVVAIAKAQLGDRWRSGAVGPSVFDCSGLVYYSFRQAGYLSRIGGRRSAYGYLAYFRSRGLASTTNGKVGDLVVWGGGSHVGIYLGNGMAISTLTNGVRVHGVHAVTARFTAFLHTGLSAAPAAAAAPAPTPAVPAAPPVVPAAAPTVPATPTNPAGALTVTTTVVAPWVRHTRVSLNLRTRPGTRFRVIQTLRRGTTLVVLKARHARGRTWYNVRLRSGATGWVAGWYTRG